MRPYVLGPVEFLVLIPDGIQEIAAVVGALATYVAGDALRIIDAAVCRVAEDGGVAVVEVEPALFRSAGIELVVPGLATEEDLVHVASGVPRGSAACILLVELAWLRRISEEVAPSGAILLRRDGVPALVATAALERALDIA